MSDTTLPLVTSQAGNVVNVVAAGLVIAYGYAHLQQKRARIPAVKRRWRRRSGAILAGFAFYALLVATWGPADSWVATVGRAIDSNIQEFATEIVLLGERSEATSTPDQIVDSVKLVGLVAYVAVFGLISVSQSAVVKLGTSIGSLIGSGKNP
ncbi:MAG: hypothetical protein V5A36_00865 [Natronomonas sp.]